MREWKPIESAPKDGTEIDLWIVDPLMPMEFREPNCWWRADAGRWMQMSGWVDTGPCYATHWMPLPEPPK